MTPRRILITGASGFVGSHLAPALLRAFPDAMLHAATGDITDAAAVAEEVSSVRPDACIDLALIAAIFGPPSKTRMRHGELTFTAPCISHNRFSGVGARVRSVVCLER